MARIKNGITGGFSGKVGAIIGYQLRGKDYLRSKAKPTTKLPTQKQLANRERFRLMQAWRSRFTVFFATTFKNHTHERSAQNAAHAFNAGIIVGEYPAYYIDASKVVISKGQLPGLAGLNMQVDGEKQLHFSWNNSYGNGALSTDLLSILIWYDEGDIYEASTTAAQRVDEALTYTLKYPGGQTFADVYVTVLSDDRERAANSCYMGRVEL